MMHMPEDGFTADNKYEVYENSSHIMHIDRVFFEDSILDPIYQLSPYKYALSSNPLLSIVYCGFIVG